MINIVSKMNGIDHVGSIENNNAAMFGDIMKMINDHSHVDNDNNVISKSTENKEKLLASNDTHSDKLAEALVGVVNNLKDFIAEEVRKNTNSVSKDNSAMASSKRYARIVTKELATDIRSMYLDGKTYDEIQQKYNIDRMRVYRPIISIFDIKPVGSNATFKSRARYILLKEIIKEINKRNKMHLIKDIKKYSEYRHFVKNMPWDKAIVTPIEYIRRDASLTRMFNEILGEFKAADKYYANKVKIKIK